MQVVTFKGIVSMSSKDIAALCEKRHDHVIRDIRAMLEALQKDSPVLGHLEKLDKRGYTSEFLLDKTLALTLVTGYDVEARHRMVVRWQQLEHELATKTNERQAARLEAPAMTAAIQGTRTELGKDTLPHHYSNEYDMINRIVLGCTSSAYRKKNELEKDDAIRDAMTALQIAAVTELQRVNTSLIEVGTEYEDRKAKLTALFMRKHAAKLTEEIMRLEA